jgi:hypothetical protein
VHKPIGKNDPIAWMRQKKSSREHSRELIIALPGVIKEPDNSDSYFRPSLISDSLISLAAVSSALIW